MYKKLIIFHKIADKNERQPVFLYYGCLPGNFAQHFKIAVSRNNSGKLDQALKKVNDQRAKAVAWRCSIKS